MNRVFLDSFSGKVADLKPRERGDPICVLQVLSVDPVVSTWDMDAHKKNPLWQTMKELESRGWVKSVDKVEFPWLKYQITKEGRKALRDHKKRMAHERKHK